MPRPPEVHHACVSPTRTGAVSGRQGAGVGEEWSARSHEIRDLLSRNVATTASAVSAAERDALLATKLHVPGPRPGLVARRRQAERLDEGLGQGLMLVCAPAGSGKTVPLADWARCAQRPVAWLSLGAGDNDPARFWRHAVAALDGPRPRYRRGRPGCTSCWPPAPTRRWHWRGCGGRGQLAELRDAELRFTAGEAAAMLREAAGPPRSRLAAWPGSSVHTTPGTPCQIPDEVPPPRRLRPRRCVAPRRAPHLTRPLRRCPRARPGQGGARGTSQP